MKHVTLSPFPGTGLSAQMNRERVAADLRSKRASVGLWLAVSLSLGIALMAAYTQLLAAAAAFNCAAGV